MPVPPGEIGLRRRHHLSALWWLGLLYRRPLRFKAALAGLRPAAQLTAGGLLCLHLLPYLVLVTALGRLVLFGVFGVLLEAGMAAPGDSILLVHAAAIARGIAVGIAFGIAGGVAVGVAVGVAFGIALGVALGIASRITSGIAGGIAEGITEGIVVGIAFGVAVGVSFGIAFGIAWSVGSLRVYYHLAHLFFVWPRSRGHWYPYHPVAWDDLCVLPFPQLDLVLMAYAEQHPQAGEQEIERLIETYPAQRMAALRAKARLMARRAADEPLGRLDTAVADLLEGADGFLRDTAKLRDMVGEIARLQHGLEGQDRPFLREPVAAQLAEKIENVRHRLGGLSEPLASEFRAAAQHWSARAHDQHAAIRHKLERSPAPLVFRAGDPVERCREAFVPRTRVVGQLDRQLTLATGCPALILYGRRRMGKSTVLRNLQGFLPDAVLVAQLSMQKAKAFSAQTSLLVRSPLPSPTPWAIWAPTGIRARRIPSLFTTTWRPVTQARERRISACCWRWTSTSISTASSGRACSTRICWP